MPLRGRRIHGADGSLGFQPYGRRGERIWCVERPALNRLLLEAACEERHVVVHDEAIVRGVDVDARAVTLADGRTFAGDLLIGADGVHSKVREALAPAPMTTLDRGYIEIRIPAAPGGAHRFERDCFHLWPRGTPLFAAFPNPSGDLTGSLFLPLAGPAPSFEALPGAALARFVAATFPDVAALVPDLDAQCTHHPVGTLPMVHAARWVSGDGRVFLVGDAAHGIVPFMGQGMNCGLEDARILGESLASAPSLPEAAARYEASRKPNAEAIGAISLAHYAHLAAVPSEEEVLEGRLHARLLEAFPDRFEPLYERCAFREVPYAEAWRDERTTLALCKQLAARTDARALVTGPPEALAAALEEARARGDLQDIAAAT
jgi:kynurenine 3-monooxygenase